jgi:hypothetical protein
MVPWFGLTFDCDSFRRVDIDCVSSACFLVEVNLVLDFFLYFLDDCVDAGLSLNIIKFPLYVGRWEIWLCCLLNSIQFLKLFARLCVLPYGRLGTNFTGHFWYAEEHCVCDFPVMILFLWWSFLRYFADSLLLYLLVMFGFSTCAIRLIVDRFILKDMLSSWLWQLMLCFGCRLFSLGNMVPVVAPLVPGAIGDHVLGSADCKQPCVNSCKGKFWVRPGRGRA